MPNYCECILKINGPTNDVTSLLESVKEDKDPFSFNKIIPYLQKYAAIDKAARDYEQAHPNDWAGRPKDGYNQGGYEWCLKNWGTKWDACCPAVFQHGGTMIMFETAWGPPIPVIRELAKQYPDLQFELNYFEQGAGYCGTFATRRDEETKEIEEVNERHEYHGFRGG